MQAILCSSLIVGTLISAQDPEPGAQHQQAELLLAGPRSEGAHSMDLTLAAAVEIALRGNLGLRKAVLEEQAARHDHLGSWGAFAWDLTGWTSYGANESPGSNSFEASVIDSTSAIASMSLLRPLASGGSFSLNFNTMNQTTNSAFAVGADFNRSSLGVTFVQPLRRGAWEEYATANQRERRLDWVTAGEIRRGERHALIESVHNAYWDLVAAREQWQVAASSLRLGLELLAKRNREWQAGVGTEVEVLQAEAETATSIEALLLAENDLESRADELKLILLDEGEHALWDRTLLPSTGLPQTVSAEGVGDWADSFVTALDQRSDLRLQRLAVERVGITLVRARSEQLSGIDLELQANSDGQSESASNAVEDTLGWEFPGWSAKLTWNMPIGNVSATRAALAAETRLKIANLEYDRLEMAALAEVRGAVRDLLYRTEAVRAAVSSLALAQRQFEAEQLRYDEGLSTNYQVLEFQRDFVQARRNERQARVEYVKARTGLLAAQGVLDGRTDKQ